MSHISRKASQIERTKGWIEEALITLMEQGHYDDITVSQLCAKAGIGRQTFYRHYSSIDDVLRAIFTRVSQSLINGLEQTDPKQVDLAQINLATLRVMKANQRLMILARDPAIRVLYSAFFQEVMDQLVATFPIYDKLDPMIRSFRFWGVQGVFFEWIQQGMEKSPEEISALISRWTVNLELPQSS